MLIHFLKYNANSLKFIINFKLFLIILQEILLTMNISEVIL